MGTNGSPNMKGKMSWSHFSTFMARAPHAIETSFRLAVFPRCDLDIPRDCFFVGSPKSYQVHAKWKSSRSAWVHLRFLKHVGQLSKLTLCGLYTSPPIIKREFQSPLLVMHLWHQCPNSETFSSDDWSSRIRTTTRNGTYGEEKVGHNHQRWHLKFTYYCHSTLT
jgi:hypothetical protein